MSLIRKLSKKVVPFWLGKKLRGAYQKYLGFKYKGDKYYCPYCEHSFKKMLPDGFKLDVIEEKQIIGSGYRDNCTCPRCFSKDRDRLIYLYINNETEILSQPTKLLHIAPEAWLKELFIRTPHLEYTCGVKGASKMTYYYDRMTRELDITNLEMRDHLYDVIICNHVLEHISDDAQAISEIYRVLKPGGWAILQVPYSALLHETYEDPSIISKHGREKHFGQFDHVRIYGLDYLQRLEKAGFKAEQYNPKNSEIKIENLEKYALNELEELFVVRKPL